MEIDYKQFIHPDEKNASEKPEATSLFSFRVSYYASQLLKWFGIAYCCLGIISIFWGSLVCQNSLYVLFGVFGIGIGLALWKFRTNRNKKALIILAITVIVFLSNWYGLHCHFETLLFELCCYLSGLFVIPGFFVITYGHSLFGSNSLMHEQVKNACKHKFARCGSEVLIGIMPRKGSLFHYLFTMIHLIIIYSAITVLLSMLWYSYFLRYWVVR